MLETHNDVPELRGLELHSGVGMGLRPCYDRPSYWIDDRENRVCPNREFSVSSFPNAVCELTLLRLCANTLNFPSRPLSVSSYRPPQLCAQAPRRRTNQRRPKLRPIRSTFYSPFLSCVPDFPCRNLAPLVHIFLTSPGLLVSHLRPSSNVLPGPLTRSTYMRCPREGTVVDTFYLYAEEIACVA